MGDLPPDLDRLGHALTHATERAVTRRSRAAHRRRLLIGCALAAFCVFAAMPAGAAVRCDQRNSPDACIQSAPQAAR